MNQIRLTAMFLILTASFHISAQTMTGFLDLSQLNRGANAGQYHIGVGINALPTAAFDVVQKWEHPKGVDGELEPLACHTEFSLVAGDVSVIMTDAEKNTAATLKTSIVLAGSHWDDSEKCTPIDGIFSGKLTFSAYFLLGGVALDYPAPADFDKMMAGISVMPFGNTVELMPSMVRGKPVVRNLTTQLDTQLKRGNQEGLYFYTWAENEAGMTEELGRGYIELK
jgi:hypothetical protein